MTRTLVRCAGVAAVAVMIGCGNDVQSPPAPTPPPSAPAPVPSPGSGWYGDAVVLSTVRGNGGPCSWGIVTGETRQNVIWRVLRTGSSVTLDEDMSNWPTDDVPYSGTLTGQHFTATSSNRDDYLKYACQFKGGELSGDFNADFTRFEAMEMLTWGPPGSESTVKRRWIVTLY